MGNDINREKELENLIWTLENKSEREKSKRTFRTVCFLSIVFYILLLFFEGVSEPLGFILNIPAAFVLAGLYFYVNMLIFLPIWTKSQQENIAIEKYKTELKILREREM